jgi:hypothetical protein
MRHTGDHHSLGISLLSVAIMAAVVGWTVGWFTPPRAAEINARIVMSETYGQRAGAVQVGPVAPGMSTQLADGEVTKPLRPPVPVTVSPLDPGPDQVTK